MNFSSDEKRCFDNFSPHAKKKRGKNYWVITFERDAEDGRTDGPPDGQSDEWTKQQSAGRPAVGRTDRWEPNGYTMTECARTLVDSTNLR